MKIKRVLMMLCVLACTCGINGLYAQNTYGTDFWLTFGKVIRPFYSYEIRIVGGSHAAVGTIYFTATGASVPFSVGAGQIYSYTLNANERYAACSVLADSTDMAGSTYITNHSIHITSNEPVAVYALNQRIYATDATYILPSTVLGTDYYFIASSFQFIYDTQGSVVYMLDSYGIVATRDSTLIYEDGILKDTLNTGQVYAYTYPNSPLQRTKYARITSSKPVALFTINPHSTVVVPSADNLFEQLSPVNTWGRNYFVPVSWLGKDVVRIVASQDNTVITQTGGIIRTGGFTLNAGEWVELEVSLANSGCYIRADKPVEVCTFLTGCTYNNKYISTPNRPLSDPSQAWVPPLEQMQTSAVIAPFYPNNYTGLEFHYALIVTPTGTKNSTTVAAGNAVPAALSGGQWYDNAAAGMSFYSMPIADSAYTFTNPAGLFIMGYGIGYAESYYYLASAAMRDLTYGGFYVNDKYYLNLASGVCEDDSVRFRADITEDMSAAAGHLKWFINGAEESAARDMLLWSRELAAGVYRIEMVVTSAENRIDTVTGELTVGQVYNDTISDTFCSGSIYVFNEDTLIAAGTYTDTLHTVNGCDSIVTLNLTVNPLNEITVDTAICFGETYNFYGTSISVADTYTTTLTGTGAECDTVVTLNLTVNPFNQKTLTKTVCENQPYDFYGKDLTVSGTYKDTVSGAECDTVVTLNLTVNPFNQKTLTKTVCENQPYDFYGKIINVSGTYKDTVPDVECDTIVTLNLTVNPLNEITVDTAICFGETYNFYGTSISVADTYTTTLTGTGAECDTVVTLNLTLKDCMDENITVELAGEICADDTEFEVLFETGEATLESVSVIFTDKARAAGFTDIVNQSISGQNFFIPLPAGVRPDNYTATIIFEGSGFSKEIAFDFTVLYPASIIGQRWNDVLALLNEHYNGGYTFSDYQWYKNGVQIDRQNGSYLYVGANGEELDFTAEYRAKITRIDDGVTLFTCGIFPAENPNAMLTLRPTLLAPGQQITIITEDGKRATIWNVLGIQVAEYPLVRGTNTINAPNVTGAYILQIENQNGIKQNKRILVE